jgi:hypothetical protein
MDDSAKVCSNCDRNRSVTVLTPEEREGFQGVTINQEQERQENGYYEYSSTGPNHRVHVRQVHFNSGTGFLSRLFIVLAILAFLAALVLVALPLAVIVIGVVAVISFIIRMMR